jgi:hypothetical protein
VFYSENLMYLARANVKPDWMVRDMYHKFLVHNKENPMLDQMHAYLIQKIEQDFQHLKAIANIERQLVSRHIQFFECEPYSRGVDIMVLTKYLNVGLEAKGHSPPWAGANPLQHDALKRLAFGVYYVWRGKDSSLQSCNVKDATATGGNVTPTSEVRFAEVLDLIETNGGGQ